VAVEGGRHVVEAAGGPGPHVDQREAIQALTRYGMPSRTLDPYVGGVSTFRTIRQGVPDRGYQGMILSRTD
jgi:hypothetical protein